MNVAAKPAVSDWRSFELAVAAFLRALEPGARVTHDAYTPDRDTGTLRQRDVWVETKLFGGLATIKVLVSCKRKKAKLSQQDIDAFVGEFIASGAHKGILYSHAGYSKPALKKAGRLGISCCRLFDDEHPDIPEVISVTAYSLREVVKLGSRGISLAGFRQVVTEPLADQPNGPSMLQRLVLAYEAARTDAIEAAGPNPLPCWSADLDIEVGERAYVTLTLTSSWKIHRARPEACLLNGSYSYTDASFSGSLDVPPVSRTNPLPGQGWERVMVEPKQIAPPAVLIYAHGNAGGILKMLIEYFEHL